MRGHPAPRQRAAALCTPARWENWKALDNDPGLSSSPLKGVQGLPAGVWGVPSFLPSFARRLRRRAKEKKKVFCGDTPHPGKGLPPSALLLDGRIGKPWVVVCLLLTKKNKGSILGGRKRMSRGNGYGAGIPCHFSRECAMPRRGIRLSVSPMCKSVPGRARLTTLLISTATTHTVGDGKPNTSFLRRNDGAS
ncbi:hypothetical protein [Reticulibacter mediterranei]|uniref:hypothetical protein n=1 Tax=Reticulibacter mediterranei TaxID=2778369 RepID=UPI001C692479|nr:hypothetical protein [Reticulibacter mediterranei]